MILESHSNMRGNMDTFDNNEKYSVDVIIPTYKPIKGFGKLIKRLEEQHYGVNKIIIINTDEELFTSEEIIEKYNNIELHHIRKEEFNHGLTRNMGVSFSNADYVVFMTQDALPMDRYLIDELIRPFKDSEVYMTYARQQANKNCKYVEKYIRSFNYPDKDITKSRDDLDTMGIKAIFCSDVCAAYDRKKFVELGEFEETNFNEDTFFAYKVLMNGKKIHYASCANVLHSHNYTYMQQFKRNFQIGKSQSEHAEIFENIKSESEGIKMVKSALSHILRHGKWYMVPDLLISSGFKYIGYKMGRKYYKYSDKFVEKCSFNG